MTVNSTRIGSASCALTVLLSLALFSACEPPPAPEPPPDPKGELLSALEGIDVGGYRFAFSEGEGQTTSSLTNPAVRAVITLDEGDSSVALSYTSIEDTAAKTKTLYKSEVVKTGASLRLAVTELATDRVIDDEIFPDPDPACEPQFESLTDCINDFNCQHKGRLLCEANRTCKPQLAALTCCLTNGQIFSVHLIIPPDSFRCRFKDLVPDLEGLVLSQD